MGSLGAYSLLLLTVAVAMASCGKSDDKSTDNPSGPSITPTTFFSTMENLTVEVVYEVGAKPFTDIPNRELNPWEILRQNLAAVFETGASEPDITVPFELAEMTEIPARNDEVITSTEILNLATQYQSAPSSLTDVKFMILFFNGYLDDGTGNPDKNVIGVSLTGTTIIGMFKPVINANDSPFPVVARFVEQSTLVHEMGHALGLVNNGVPLTSEHQDEDNGAHCTNENCVMYWLNEGVEDLKKFVVRYQQLNSFVMFGQLCADDIANFNP